MTNSNKISPSYQSMNQRLEMPLEAVINNASKHYIIKTNASSSQSAKAPGTSQESSIASSIVQSADAPGTFLEDPWGSPIFQCRASLSPSQRRQLRAKASSFIAQRQLAHRPLLKSVQNSAATSRTLTRGFAAHRSFIKKIWDRAEAASENSGAHISTTILDPTAPAFIPSPVVSRSHTSTTILDPTTPPFIPSPVVSRSHTPTTILDPTTPAFIPSPVVSRSHTPTSNLDPTTPVFIPSPELLATIPQMSPELLARIPQVDVASEYDCGFSHCGGFCVRYVLRATNNDNNEAGQQASSSPMDSRSHTPITKLDPTTPPFTPSPKLNAIIPQVDVASEYDCGFSHCGGFCARYA
ncbi:hypothetical protein BGAL_0102g00280 [Botrytis galanthina]|uniref:Uncharacterized protein n=1 Tax=Botrytis galanthina TaxID=278940 RepID=A0A4V4HV27_9HELO|nr:hypothetical protein BGAL_0102g00280 [Botrytis galanthina]